MTHLGQHPNLLHKSFCSACIRLALHHLSPQHRVKHLSAEPMKGPGLHMSDACIQLLPLCRLEEHQSTLHARWKAAFPGSVGLTLTATMST